MAALTSASTSVTVTITGACNGTDILALFCFEGAPSLPAALPRCFVTAVAGAAPPDTNLAFPFKFKRVRAVALYAAGTFA